MPRRREIFAASPKKQGMCKVVWSPDSPHPLPLSHQGHIFTHIFFTEIARNAQEL